MFDLKRILSSYVVLVLCAFFRPQSIACFFFCSTLTMSTVRCSHLLCKHTGSRNPVSRRTGQQITMSKEEAIAELNLVCHGDTKDVRDGMVMQRRRRYRELLEPLLLQGKLYKKQFRPGISTMEKTDRFTKENSFQTVSKNLLLGIPDPSVDLTVRVETEDDT